MKESDIIKKILYVIIILITSILIPLNINAETTQEVIHQEKKDTVEITLTGTIILISILYIYKKKKIKL